MFLNMFIIIFKSSSLPSTCPLKFVNCKINWVRILCQVSSLNPILHVLYNMWVQFQGFGWPVTPFRSAGHNQHNPAHSAKHCTQILCAVQRGLFNQTTICILKFHESILCMTRWRRGRKIQKGDTGSKQTFLSAGIHLQLRVK